jgi:hypothetical protein
MAYLKALSDFSVAHDINADITQKIFIESLQLAAQKLWGKRLIIFDLETATYKEMENGVQIRSGKIESLGIVFYRYNRVILYYLLNKKYPQKFGQKIDPNKEIKELLSLEGLYNSKQVIDFDRGNYCSSCQQTPCMCSDRELTSNAFEY